MLRNKKGFTLVELLAVIVILAIILAIAVPTISTLIAGQKKAAFEAGVKMLIKGVDYAILQDSTKTAGALTSAGVATYGGSSTDYGTFTVTSISPTTVTVAGGASGKFSGCTVTGGTFTNLVHTGTAGAAGVISGC